MANDVISLMRVHRWHKNLLIFVPLIFSLNFFNIGFILKTVLGFISLGLISSAYYISNDLTNIRHDRFHPTKKSRPLAAGRIGRLTAFTIMLLSFLGGLYIAYSLSVVFMLLVALLFLNMQIYNFWTRNIPYAESVTVALNFAVKAFSGIFIINSPISLWIIIAAFFLGALIVFGKRYSELKLLGAQKFRYRPVLKDYSEEILRQMITLCASGLIVSYAIYTILAARQQMIITLPVVFYIIAVYIDMIYNSPAAARNPKMVLKNRKLVGAAGLLVALLALILYA